MLRRNASLQADQETQEKTPRVASRGFFVFAVHSPKARVHGLAGRRFADAKRLMSRPTSPGAHALQAKDKKLSASTLPA